MKVTILYPYTEMVVPPRCRKARPTRMHGTMTVDIPEVQGKDAPVALIGHAHPFIGAETTVAVEYRVWQGNLWTRQNLCEGVPRELEVGGKETRWPKWPSVIDLESYATHYAYGLHINGRDNEADTKQEIARVCDGQLIIDGEFYRTASEPRYVVMTFGLGNNHGGTGLFVTDHYNGNVANSRYHSLLNLKQATEQAEAVARDRGDTDSLPMEVSGPRYEILMPQVLRVEPATQHGEGDPFLNQIDEVSRKMGGNRMGGLVVMAAAIAGTATGKAA